LFETFVSGQYLLWGIGVVVALMTAFYMGRSLMLAFHGESRVKEEAKHHLHESPWVMTSALAVLAIFSLIGGFVGLPLGHSFFGNFLEPVTGKGAEVLAALGHGTHGAGGNHASLEFGLAAFSSVVGLTGLFVAVILYGKHFPAKATVASQKLAFLYRLSFNKWYWDDIYNTFVMRGCVVLAWIAWKFDEYVIDGILHLIGYGVAGSAYALRRFQNGQIQSYAVAMLLGLNALLLIVVWLKF
ncbi:MAG: hypothetical protein V2A74_08010, partial [bacterium]